MSTAALRVRPEDELRATPAAAGFTVEHVHGTLDRRPVGPGPPELVVVARRPG